MAFVPFRSCNNGHKLIKQPCTCFYTLCFPFFNINYLLLHLKHCRQTMERTKQIGKNTVALLLFLALMLPTAIQFSHAFEGHDHIPCEDDSRHFHQDVPDCHTCDFHLTSFNYDVAEYTDLSLPKFIVKNAVNFTSLQFNSFKKTNTQLRAPPVFS